MIRKLKLKFIAITSGSLLIVLIVVLGIINWVSYFNAKKEIFSLMTNISENRGKLPERMVYRSIMGDSVLTEESRFSLRYFMAILDENGNIEALRMDHVSSVSEEDARKNIMTAEQRNEPEGFLYLDDTTYAFQKTGINVNGQQKYQYVIMDCTRQMLVMRSFTKFSIYIGLVSMSMLLLLLSFFSKRAVAPLVKNMENQKMFITNAGHELKTPLSIISANTEVLEMTEGKNEWTESTMQQVKRMTELISNLITLSKMQEKNEITLTEVSFSEITEQVADEFRILAEKEGLGYETAITPDRIVKADKDGLREIVSILIDNAVKYCSPEGTIRVALDAKMHGTILTVSNTYPENKHMDYSKFFDRFYRADESHNSEKMGFGIGLSMAEHFTELFHGKINVHYKDGMIHFTVSL